MRGGEAYESKSALRESQILEEGGMLCDTKAIWEELQGSGLNQAGKAPRPKTGEGLRACAWIGRQGGVLLMCLNATQSESGKGKGNPCQGPTSLHWET